MQAARGRIGLRAAQRQRASSHLGQSAGGIEQLLRARVPFLTRFGQGMVPTDDTLLQDGDILYVALANEDVPRVEQILSEPPLKH